MNTIKLIVGLGNPSFKFYNTRHNIGTWYLKILANSFKVTLNIDKKFSAKIACILINNHKIYLFQPETYMNICGSLIFKFASYYKIHSSEILIVRDELDLLPGVLKLRNSKGHNGHNGVKDIKLKFKKNCFFMQLCIGIGRPNLKNEIAKFVLSAPSIIEKKLIKRVIIKFISYTEKVISKKTSLFNKKFFISKI